MNKFPKPKPSSLKNKTIRASLIQMVLFSICLYASPNMASKLPDTSVYQYESTWLNQDNQEINLTTLQGKARLIAFIYTYCEHTCPYIIAQIQTVLKNLPGPLGESMLVTLITLDPKRDTPAQLKSYLLQHNLDQSQWSMLTGHEDDVRVLSNLFGVKYKAMAKDELAHSNMITLLDTDGVIRHQMKGFGEPVAIIVDKIMAIGSVD
jgi:protein SCO1/2